MSLRVNVIVYALLLYMYTVNQVDFRNSAIGTDHNKALDSDHYRLVLLSLFIRQVSGYKMPNYGGLSMAHTHYMGELRRD